MRPVSSYPELAAAIESVRLSAPEYTTNLFASPEKARAWIDRGTLLFDTWNRCVLIFRREDSFYRVYHASADVIALDGALSTLAGRNGATYVTDIVGRAADVERLAACYLSRGFGRYTSLVRMVRRRAVGQDFAVDTRVEVAIASDGRDILAFLERQLDPLAEQIPDEEELLSTVNSGQVLVVRDGRSLAGILLYDTVGFTAHLHYWFVDELNRGRGIGASLMRTFVGLCGECARIVLWVLRDNADAIAKYEHYGFESEGLVDEILVRQTGA